MPDLNISGENGVLETMQVLVLLLATLVLLTKLYRARRGTRTFLCYCLPLAAIPLVGAAREVSFGRMVGAPPDMVIALKVLVIGMAALMILWSLTTFFRQTETPLADLRRYAAHRASISLYIGMAIFGIGSVFEDGRFGAPHSELAEELLELVAFCFILRAALIVKPSDRLFVSTGSSSAKADGFPARD